MLKVWFFPTEKSIEPSTVHRSQTLKILCGRLAPFSHNLFWRTGSRYAAPAGLELALYSRLVSNSKICLLLLPRPGIKCMHYHAWQNQLLRGSKLNTTLGSFRQPSPEEVRLASRCSSPSTSCADGGGFISLWEGLGGILPPTMTKVRVK